MPIAFRSFVVTTILGLALCEAPSAFAQAKAGSGSGSTVIYTSGNDLVLRSADGKLLNYMAPANATFETDGKKVLLADLKPGMKLTKEVSIGSEPEIISDVQVVRGKVFAATPPDVVTLALAGGIKELIVPSGTHFMVSGKSMTIDGLKADMTVEATVVTTIAPDATLDSANAPATPPMTGPILIAKTEGAAALPEAGTNLPLYGLLGSVLLILGAALMLVSKSQPKF